jgi:hypothetical protein
MKIKYIHNQKAFQPLTAGHDRPGLAHTFGYNLALVSPGELCYKSSGIAKGEKRPGSPP